MAAFPLSILALAAGVALLIKVKKDGLGMLYTALSWLVVLLALAFMLHLGRMAWRHHKGMDGEGHCGHRMGHYRMMMDGNCCDIQDGKDSAGGMTCWHMKGDSGTMSNEECMKKCRMDGNQSCMSGGGGCMHEGGRCCPMHGSCCGMSMGGGCCNGVEHMRSCCEEGGAKSSCCESGGGMEKCSGEKAETKACCKK